MKATGLICVMLIMFSALAIPAAATPIDDLFNFLQNIKLPEMQWYSPTNQYTLDTAGLHFYSGHTGSITWYLKNVNGIDVSSQTTSGLGYYTFPLPTQSDDYLLYCTASGCETGDWIRINLANIPQSPADTIISGSCNGSPCQLPSKNFPYLNGLGKPTNYACNTCSPRDVNSVPGVNTAAMVVPTPTSPSDYVTPTPQITTLPPPTSTPISTPTPIQTSTPKVTQLTQVCEPDFYPLGDYCVRSLPGFEAMFAILGLIVTAIIVLREKSRK